MPYTEELRAGGGLKPYLDNNVGSTQPWYATCRKNEG